MRIGRSQHGGDWRVQFAGEEVTWRFARPTTPALLDLEAAAAPLESKRIKLKKILVERGDLGLQMSTKIEEVNARRGASDDAAATALAHEISAITQQMHDLDLTLVSERITAEELQPYYGFALHHTLGVTPLTDERGAPIAWETLTFDQRMDLLEQLSQPALIHYCDAITQSASLGHAKKKPSVTSSEPTSSTPASATSAPARATPAKQTGRSTTARSRRRRKK